MATTTTTDFSGEWAMPAPSATAALNAVGKIVTIQAFNYLSRGPVNIAGTTAQNDSILVVPLFPTGRKILTDVVKTAGATWTKGQAVQLIVATGIYTVAGVSSGVVAAGVAAADAASADVLGDVLPCSPF